MIKRNFYFMLVIDGPIRISANFRQVCVRIIVINRVLLCLDKMNHGKLNIHVPRLNTL